MIEAILVLTLLATPGAEGFVTSIPGDSPTLVVCRTSVKLPCGSRTCGMMGQECPSTPPLMLPSPTSVPTVIRVQAGSCVASGWTRQPPHGGTCWCLCSDMSMMYARCRVGQTASEARPTP